MKTFIPSANYLCNNFNKVCMKNALRELHSKRFSWQFALVGTIVAIPLSEAAWVGTCVAILCDAGSDAMTWMRWEKGAMPDHPQQRWRYYTDEAGVWTLVSRGRCGREIACLESAKGRGRFGGQTAGGSPKAFSPPRQPPFWGPLRRFN